MKFDSLLFALLGVALACPVSAADEAVSPPDYGRDVKPLLAQKCFACHGALRQESDLRLDAYPLLREGGDSGSPINLEQPNDSLLLERVSQQDADLRMPPEGQGEALDAGQIDILRRWIAAGAPGPADEPIPPSPRQHWAYQTPVRPPLPQLSHGSEIHNAIDVFLAAKREQHGVLAVGEADRLVLLRRVYLDLIGLPPSRAEQHAFLADESPQAYQRVVDRLLSSRRYGERWGRHWMDVWRYSDWSGYKAEIRNSQRHIWRWRDWIVESLNDDKPYDRMIVEMLAADEVAPTDDDTLRATGFLARNWYKFNRNFWLDQTVEHTSKSLLGVTMNCARCHDHKYDPIAQTSYYQMRAIFEPHNVRTDRVPGQIDIMQDGVPRAFDAQLEVPTYLYERGNDKHPVKDNPLAPGIPTIFGEQLEIQPVQLPVEAYYPALRDFVVEDLLRAERAKVELARKAAAAASKHHETVLRQLVTTRTASQDSSAKDQSAKATPAEEEPAVAEQPTENAASIEAARDALAESLLKRREAELAFTAATRTYDALEKRIAADRAKYREQPLSSGDEVSKLARAASAAELLAAESNAEVAVVQAEVALLAAVKQVEQSDEKKRKEANDNVAKADKALAEARKKLAAATQASDKPTEKYTPVDKQYPRTSTGRRLALAQWITDRNNPLTARVAVNHIWLRHFGAPLVDNVFDFGLRSPRPRHAELLDWLAVELVESGWSMKHLHRLIVTSAAYRMQSSTRGASPANLDLDPDNHWLWRMNSRRLEAEVVRDATLAVAGSIDLAEGGPDIDHEIGQTSRRRSVYFRHAYEKKMKFLELFDVASENECYRRSESVIPQQALAMANSPLSLAQARLLARRLSQAIADGDSAASDDAFVRLAFAQVLSREATAEELATCRAFLSQQAELLSDAASLTTFAAGEASQVAPSSDPALRARENLVHVLLNHNDFVTLR
ncbi:MAG: DUF1553 domain-containing protein [Pirellulaceae bacterium]